MHSKIKWGIIGLGNIAHQFCNDLLLVEDAEIYAVASRSKEKSQAFAKEYKAEKTYDSYEALMNDENVDIIYIATPHISHASLTVQALNKGKNVLCEKPIALNYSEAKQMIEASKKNNKFFMEAFWSRFNPSIVNAHQKIVNGEIGEVNYINADFCFYVENPKGTRLYELELGGGSLLDIGVYPLFLSYFILGKPERIVASANFFETGADSQTSMILHYKNAQAVLNCSFLSNSKMVASICGSKGRIEINPTWFLTQSYSVIKGDSEEEFKLPTKGKGFTYEIEECHKCIRNNKMESENWSHQNSLDLIEMVDKIKSQIGLKYPSEKV